MVRYAVFSNALEAVVFDRGDRTWIHVRSSDASYPSGFFSSTPQANKVPDFMRSLATKLVVEREQPSHHRGSSMPLVEVATATKWQYWGTGIPAPIVDYVRSTSYASAIDAAKLID